MRIEPSPPYLVAPRFGNHRLAHTSQQWPYHQHTAAQCRTLTHELGTPQIVEVKRIGLKAVFSWSHFVHLHADVFQQQDEVVDIANVGHVAHNDLVAGE